MHALFEGGAAEVDDLDTYVREDVTRFGAKLDDIYKRLRHLLKENLVNLQFVCYKANYSVRVFLGPMTEPRFSMLTTTALSGM